jgi:hypothetical protein
MRSRPLVPRSLAAAAIFVAALAAALSAGTVFAKEGAYVTLATPIPRDAEPGTIINVEFTVLVLDGEELTPMTGSPIVLKLIGPDGTTTEAMGGDQGRGTYVASIEVPSSGIETAEFGVRGTGLAEDGSEVTMDLPLAVDGPLLTTVADPAAAPPAVTTSTPPPPATAAPDDRPWIVLAAAAVAVGLGLIVVTGRRRSLRSA